MAKKSQSFEQSITRLDEIVRQLEQGNVPLEDALKLFQEGTALVDTCGKLLDQGGAGGREADENRRWHTGRNGV